MLRSLVGSEMCIRDSLLTSDVDTFLESVSPTLRDEYYQQQDNLASMFPLLHAPYSALIPCLLYTSDAADEEDSVDLGGRRIIKKKKINKIWIDKVLTLETMSSR
eukprot:TRINITY_DN22083_c0_g1_i3.p1 TRINITY_DN22083_c0_g1~~TRINITY_DN22083_c0_g1_i3.p1  ORF type:complete len:105 (-),score=31.22 TRINITY_DN22083_c0_g1_i3:36-350(-)